MLKQFFLFIQSIGHVRKKHKAWEGHKYLLVKAFETYHIPHVLGEEDCYMTGEFKTKQEALDYVEEHISKSDKKLCCLYKEIKL